MESVEQRKNSLTSSKSCRFCLVQDETLSSIYDRNRTPKNAITLPLQIMACVSVEVFPSDRMLTMICDRCRMFMELCYKYKQICRQADESVMQFIQDAKPMEPISWPTKLTKLFTKTRTPVKKEKIKTILADGATIQVTASNEQSDSEEEDGENVYNIKIGEGIDSDPACIKVVKSGDKLHITKDDRKSKSGLSNSPKQTSQQRENTGAGERPFPCKYCGKRFLMSHHLTRHLRSKHKEGVKTPRGPFGQMREQWRCEQCDQEFENQDTLIYHSAQHVTQNLTCPLCQERFTQLEDVSAHVKTHVNGAEFKCDLCELVFTTEEKLEMHYATKHEDELNNGQDTEYDDESMDMDGEEGEGDGEGFDEEEEEDMEDDNIKVKEVGDHMVVEIKKSGEFMISDSDNKSMSEEKNTNSEESETDTRDIDMPPIDLPSAIAPIDLPSAMPLVAVKEEPAAANTDSPVGEVRTKAKEKKPELQVSTIVRKAEEIKRKPQPAEPITGAKPTKESNTSVGTSDKSLRLLEKELQELKRTTTTSREVSKTPMKTEAPRRSRTFNSTPKPNSKVVEEKKAAPVAKASPVEKKPASERKTTKENQEPKEAKPSKTNNMSIKEEKDIKDQKDTKEPEKVQKEKETPKTIVKNGSADKTSSDENIRRSSRTSKVKDYAKMIREKVNDDDDSEEDDDDEEYAEKPVETRGRPKKVTAKTAASKAVEEAPNSAKKRGRPRKEISHIAETPPKIRRSNEGDDEAPKTYKNKDLDLVKMAKTAPVSPEKSEPVASCSKTPDKIPVSEKKKNETIMSPTGQPLKMVSMKSLPPGVKPLPLPVNARSMGTSEMQIGTKLVKVQKIVMTKSEVETMTKKGLLEFKNGTMVLKQGIKLPTSDPAALKSTLMGETGEKPSPTRYIAEKK